MVSRVLGAKRIAVSDGNKVDDGSDAAQRSLRIGPWDVRLKVEQCQQGVGGGFVPLFGAELQRGECCDGFGEPLFPDGGFAVRFSGSHEDVW